MKMKTALPLALISSLVFNGCLPSDINATEPSPDPTPTSEPGTFVYEGGGTIPEQFRVTSGTYKSIVVVCEETVKPNNNCDDITDKPLGGVPAHFNYSNGESVYTSTSGDGVIEDVQTLAGVLEGPGENKIIMPPDVLTIMVDSKTEEKRKVCMGEVFVSVGDVSQIAVVPYSEANCNKQERL